MNSKIVIIGAGNVGIAIAYSVMLRGSAREICLIDIDLKKLEGNVADMNHGRPFVRPITIRVGTYQDCATADIIIITAGARQKPNETRIELVNKNLNLLHSIISQINIEIKSNSHYPILLIVSNPVDILTYFAIKYSNWPRERVFGSGTVLDSARLRFEIASHCGVDPQNVHGYVMGEHGDTELIPWSLLRIGGMLFQQFCEYCQQKCDQNSFKEIEDEVRTSAYKIIEAKGYTDLGVGVAVTRIIEAILQNQNTILPVSTLLNGEYQLKDVALSVPCIVDSQGIQRILEIPLNEEEKQKFLKSAEHLKKVIQNTQQINN